jgi:hypothetical protein
MGVKVNNMKKSTLRLLIREAIEQVFETEIKYNVGDRVEIDSSANGGIGTVEVAAHPTYAIKFDQTGITDSYHFSDLRPFDDEEEAEKNANINTGLDESEGSFPDQLKGNDDIIWKKQWERNNQANYGAFYKGHDIEHGGVTFDSVDRLNKYVKSYILSNNWYNKLKHTKSLDENVEGIDFKGWWSDLESWAKTNKYPTLKKQLLYLASIANNYGINLDAPSWEDIFKQFNAYLKRQTVGDWDLEKSWIEGKVKQKLSLSESQTNPTDSISLDVPLFIRMLEYAREDAKTDMDLHNVTDNALKLSTTGKTLTMTDYNKIVSKK